MAQGEKKIIKKSDDSGEKKRGGKICESHVPDGVSRCAAVQLFNRAADDQPRKKKKRKKAPKQPLNTD